MPLTKERKIYLGLLAAGLAALTVDRLTGGPSAASAHDPAEYAIARPEASPSPAPASISNAAAATPATVANTNPGMITPGGGLAARLRELLPNTKATSRPAVAQRDLFRAPASWAPATPTNPVPREGLTPDEFQASHRFTAVLRKGRRVHAVVNGQMVAPGQTLNGYTLLEVNADMAVFQSKLGTAVLKPEVKPEPKNP